MPSKLHTSSVHWTLVVLVIFLLHFPSTTAVDCPSYECSCTTNSNGQNQIICSHQDLSDVPVFEQSETLWHLLDLSYSNLGSLDPNAFHGIRVQHINLEQSGLSSIHQNAFHGLQDDLESVNFAGNYLTDPPLKLLDDFHSLTELNFANNQLEQVPEAPALLKLDLSANGLRNPNNDLLLGFTELRELRLGNNELSSLPTNPINFFQDLSKLTLLHLDHNEFVQTPPGLLVPLISLEELDLTSNSINEDGFIGINEASSTVKTLILDSNELIFPQSLFLLNLRNLEKYSLEYNHITKVSSHLVKYFPKLRHLSVYGNQIDAIDDDTFQDTPEVRELNLGLNPLGDFPRMVFIPLGKLERLEVWGAEIQGLLAYSLDHVSETLTYMELGNNEFSQIPEYLLFHLLNLEFLGLSHLNLTELLDDAFDGLDKLNELRLESNKFDHIPKALSRRYIPLMTSLDMSDNMLVSVEGTEFLELPELSSVCLDGNQISHFDFRFLTEYAENDISVDLAGNQIGFVDACRILANPISGSNDVYVDVYLENNTLHCGCHVKWLREAGVRLARAGNDDQVTCQTPARLRGEKVMSLDLAFFKCDVTADDYCNDDADYDQYYDCGASGGLASGLKNIVLPILLAVGLAGSIF